MCKPNLKGETVHSEDKTIQFCPLKFNSDGYKGCDREECAWWDRFSGMCCVAAIAYLKWWDTDQKENRAIPPSSRLVPFFRSNLPTADLKKQRQRRQ